MKRLKIMLSIIYSIRSIKFHICLKNEIYSTLSSGSTGCGLGFLSLRSRMSKRGIAKSSVVTMMSIWYFISTKPEIAKRTPVADRTIKLNIFEGSHFVKIVFQNVYQCKQNQNNESKRRHQKFYILQIKITENYTQALSLKVGFFSWAVTFCKHRALTISGIDMRFFAINRERNREKKEADFLISSCSQVRNRIKSKIIGFSKTARWNSLKIKGSGHFLIDVHLKL